MKIACLPGGILRANTYVLYQENAGEAIVVDPTDLKKLEAYFAEFSLRPVAVLLTHGHFDHTPALVQLVERYSIPVYLHPGDGKMLTDPRLCCLHIFFPGAPFEPFEGYTPIADGEVLQLAGMTVEVLSTPGHSEGSVCYRIEEKLFTGDTLFRGGFGRTDMWGGNYPKLMASLKQLAMLPADMPIYPGHGAETTIAAELSNQN